MLVPRSLPVRYMGCGASASILRPFVESVKWGLRVLSWDPTMDLRLMHVLVVCSPKVSESGMHAQLSVLDSPSAAGDG